MPRKKRDWYTGATYHVMCRGIRRMAIFREAEDYEMFLLMMKQTMTTSMIQKYCKLDEESTAILKEASEKHGYSARVIHKFLRLARTAADLRGAVTISREDIIFVLGCRDLDKSNSDMYVIQ